MRLGLKPVLMVMVIGVLAVGLLPPLLEQGPLRNDANTAAESGLKALLAPTSSTATVDRSVEASILAHEGVHLVSIKIRNGPLTDEVTVRVRRDIHTFMSGLPGLHSWFEVTVSESASEN